VGGAPDPRIQWGIRIEAIQKWSGTIDNAPTAAAPGFCVNNTGLNCGIQDVGGGAFPGNTGGSFPVRMAYDFVGYFSPGGFFAKIGRISEDEGRNADGVALGGAQANGIQVGF